MGKSFQPQIRQLVQAGVATHLVENADAIDPLFALSKVRDFPQVTFAAVFEDGSVILGCPDELPPQIAEVAQPISFEELPPDPTAEVPDATPATPISVPDAVLSEHGTKLDALQATLEDQVQTAAAMQEQFAQLQAKLLEGHAAIDAKLTDSAAIDALTAQLTQLQAATENPPTLKLLSDLRDEMASFSSNAAKPADDLAFPDVGAMLEKLESNLADHIAATVDQLDQRRNAAVNGDILPDLFAAFSEEMKVFITENAVQARAEPKLESALPAIQDRLDGLVEMDKKIQQITADFAILGEKIEAASQPPDDAVPDQIRQLADQISALAARPAPIIDQTEQRQVLARFQTAMASVLTRLDAEITRIAGHAQDVPDPTTPFDSLAAQIGALGDQLTPIATLQEQIAGIDAQLRQVPAGQQDLMQAIDALGKRPAPVIDLTEQRQSLAQFANAQGVVLKRLEHVAEGLVADDADSETLAHLSRIEDQVKTLQQGTNDAKFVALLEAQSAEIGALRSDFASQLKQPAPPPDLTLQRKSFARFATALGMVVRRFESIAEQFENEQMSEATPIAGSASVDDPEPPESPFIAAPISFDALRMGFAELIAQQIMDNTVADNPAAQCDRD
ncbi:MAG: hypothetical protein AAFP85_05800 [Pseudomonadota bacterium]